MDKLIGKNISGLNQVNNININDKNFFAAQQAIGEFWEPANNSARRTSNNKIDEIQDQIQKVEMQAEEYKRILASPYGRNLNLIG